MTALESPEALDGARWTVLGEEAAKAYDFMAITEGEIALDDLFPNPPPFAVHQGALALSGALELCLRPERRLAKVFVVEGDLTVDGPLVLKNIDDYTILWVRGGLKAKGLGLSMDAHLIVEGDLKVDGLLLTDLTDAGFLVVKGEVQVAGWLALSSNGLLLGLPTPDLARSALRAELKRHPQEPFRALLAGEPLL